MVAGVYAWGLLKGRRDHYHRLGFAVPFTVAAIAMPLQFLVGDTIARQVYDREPAKFSAVELLPTTGDHVPETLGGIFVDGRVRYGIQLPDVARSSPVSPRPPRSRASTRSPQLYAPRTRS